MAVLSGRVLHDLDNGLKVKATRNDSQIRRWFDFMVTPSVHLQISFMGWRPCTDCYAGIEGDLQMVFGESCISDPHSLSEDDFDERDWTVEAVILDPQRHYPLLGSSYDEVIERVKARLDACRAGDHYAYDAA